MTAPMNRAAFHPGGSSVSGITYRHMKTSWFITLNRTTLLLMFFRIKIDNNWNACPREMMAEMTPVRLSEIPSWAVTAARKEPDTNSEMKYSKSACNM